MTSSKEHEFISIASHELRTPLTVIRGFVNLLERKQLGPVNDQQQQVLGKVNTNAKTLIDLVNNMLDLSKLESGKLKIQVSSSPLDGLVQKSIEAIKLLYDNKGVKLTYNELHDDEEIAIDTNPDKFISIMLNLLSNAYKFTDKGGSVEVSSSINDKMITICVADTGVGIPDEAMNDLFKKFSQVDNYLQRQAGGTGLGLAICKQLVGKMGGNIWAKSKLGKGSRFYFTMPLSDKKTI